MERKRGRVAKTSCTGGRKAGKRVRARGSSNEQPSSKIVKSEDSGSEEAELIEVEKTPWRCDDNTCAQ